QRQVDLPPGEEAAVEFSYQFSTPGDHVAEVKLTKEVTAEVNIHVKGIDHEGNEVHLEEETPEAPAEEAVAEQPEADVESAPEEEPVAQDVEETPEETETEESE
ncbi:MAG: hypothetical protein ACOC29_03965, partial [Candidatus Sumerlaeota bacterium]